MNTHRPCPHLARPAHFPGSRRKAVETATAHSRFTIGHGSSGGARSAGTVLRSAASNIVCGEAAVLTATRVLAILASVSGVRGTTVHPDARMAPQAACALDDAAHLEPAAVTRGATLQ